MSSKNISLKTEIYEELMKHKSKEETLSDVIARLLGKKKEFTDYEQFFGRWKDLPQEYFIIMENARQEFRLEFKRRFE